MTSSTIEGLIARLIPPAHDTFTPLGYTPTERQAEYHAIPPFSQGGPWDVLFGGAMGGGKTQALVMDGLDAATRWPGLEVWYVRETYPDLERDVFPFLENVRYAATLGGRWNGTQRTLTFPGGGRVRFLHARNKVTALGIRGQCQLLIVDERTLLNPEVVDVLAMRIRSGHSSIPVIGIRSGCNPGGIGHSTVKAAFIDPAPSGRQEIPIVDEETGHPLREDPLNPESRVLTRYFLPSLAKDNPHLDASYTIRFGMMSDDARAAFRDGDWSRFEGMRFAGFTPGLHVISPTDLPLELAELRHAKGVDWGGSSPFASIWGAVINGGETLVVYREAHEAGLTTTEQAELMLALETDAEHSQPAFVDPSTWNRSPEDPRAASTTDRPPAGSIARTYLDAGIPVRKAHNDRVAGWAKIDELLLVPDDQDPDDDEEREGPVEPRFLRVYIYDTCPNLIRSLSGAPRDPKNPQDVDPAYKDDHALDAFRYLVMGLMGGPVRQPRTSRSPAHLHVPTGIH